MPFPVALELLEYWKRFPPTHILLLQISGAFGVKSKTEKLNEAEKRVLYEPARSMNELPPEMLAFASQFTGKPN